MNALALWIPGSLLIVIGVTLLALGRLEWIPALVVIAVGIGLESVGIVMWLRQRGSRNPRSR